MRDESGHRKKIGTLKGMASHHRALYNRLLDDARRTVLGATMDQAVALQKELIGDARTARSILADNPDLFDEMDPKDAMRELNQSHETKRLGQAAARDVGVLYGKLQGDKVVVEHVITHEDVVARLAARRDLQRQRTEELLSGGMGIIEAEAVPVDADAVVPPGGGNGSGGNGSGGNGHGSDCSWW